MTEFAEKLKELRRLIRADLIECRKALKECDWDVQKALKYIEAKRSSKKDGR